MSSLGNRKSRDAKQIPHFPCSQPDLHRTGAKRRQRSCSEKWRHRRSRQTKWQQSLRSTIEIKSDFGKGTSAAMFNIVTGPRPRFVQGTTHFGPATKDIYEAEAIHAAAAAAIEKLASQASLPRNSLGLHSFEDH